MSFARQSITFMMNILLPYALVAMQTAYTTRITNISQIKSCYRQEEQTLDLSGLHIGTIDNVVFAQIAEQYPNLQTLNLAHNKIRVLPKGILLLQNLKSLDLRSNQVPFVSLEMTDLKQLRYLALDDNPLTVAEAAYSWFHFFKPALKQNLPSTKITP